MCQALPLQKMNCLTLLHNLQCYHMQRGSTLHLVLQLLHSTWYSHQCMEILYSRRCIVHPLCTQCVSRFAKMQYMGWDIHFSPILDILLPCASSQATLLPVLVARTSTQNHLKHPMTCVSDTKSGDSSSLPIPQLLNPSLAMLTTIANLSAYGCVTRTFSPMVSRCLPS